MQKRHDEFDLSVYYTVSRSFKNQLIIQSLQDIITNFSTNYFILGMVLTGEGGIQ